MRPSLFPAALLSLFIAFGPAFADPAEIVAAEAQDSGGAWRFSVTIRHGDTGWDDYADGWRVLDMDGNELGMRVLFHPHVDEQPFTRSLSGVRIPDGTTQVQIQARDLPAGWNASSVIFQLP